MHYLIYSNLNLHVGTPDDEVIAALSAKVNPARCAENPEAWEALKAGVLREHHDARALYRAVVSGDWTGQEASC